jgi:hypothetical protein
MKILIMMLALIIQSHSSTSMRNPYHQCTVEELSNQSSSEKNKLYMEYAMIESYRCNELLYELPFSELINEYVAVH